MKDSKCIHGADDTALGLRGSSEGSTAECPAGALDLHRQLAGRLGEDSLGSLEAHGHIAERIADAVAARLSHRAMQTAAESILSAHSPRLQLPASTARPPAKALEEPAGGLGSQLQMPAGVSNGDAAKPSLPGSAGGHVLQNAGEQEHSAEAHQGSPVRPGGSGQPKGAEGCEEDFLAALLGTSGSCPGQLRHAASPGLMHRRACSMKSSSASAGSQGSASPSPEPRTAHWVGKLTTQQMQHAIQEVMLHHSAPAAQLVKPHKASVAPVKFHCGAARASLRS